MSPGANPVCGHGKRNIYCEFYDSCLDFAVKNLWQKMSCESCPYRTNRNGVSDFEYTIDGDMPYYRLTDTMSHDFMYID